MMKAPATFQDFYRITSEVWLVDYLLMKNNKETFLQMFGHAVFYKQKVRWQRLSEFACKVFFFNYIFLFPIEEQFQPYLLIV